MGSIGVRSEELRIICPLVTLSPCLPHPLVPILGQHNQGNYELRITNYELLWVDDFGIT